MLLRARLDWQFSGVNHDSIIISYRVVGLCFVIQPIRLRGLRVLQLYISAQKDLTVLLHVLNKSLQSFQSLSFHSFNFAQSISDFDYCDRCYRSVVHPSVRLPDTVSN